MQLQVEDSLRGSVDFQPLASLSTPRSKRVTLNTTVFETPTVKSRHIDPNTSPRRGLSPPQRADPIYFANGNRIYDASAPGNTQDYDPDMMDIGDLDKVPATPGMENPRWQSPKPQNSPRATSETPDMELKESDVTPNSRPVMEVIRRKDISEHKKVEICDKKTEADELEDAQPDSLPEAFRYHELKKAHTPAKTYGRRGKRNSGGSVKSDTSPNMNPKKRKSPENADTPVKKRRPDTPTFEKRTSRETTADSEDYVKLGKRRPRYLHTTGDEVTFSTTPEESSIPEKKSPLKTPVAKPKAPKLKAAKVKTLAGETQYDIPSESEEETDNSPAPESKTSRPRRKNTPKTITPKTPATSTVNRTKTPRLIKSSPLELPTASKRRTNTEYKGPDPRIAFTGASTLVESKSTTSFVKTHSGKTVSSPADPSCNFLVTDGELKRTVKFVIAVARGLNIVDEAWLVESHAAGHWLDPEPYITTDVEREAEWEISLAEAVERGRKGRNKVLEGKTIYLTPALLQQLKQSKMESGLIEMCEAAGANNILKKSPRHTPDEEADEDGIVLAKEDGDSSVPGLEKAGWRVYSTSVIGMSVFRGKFLEGREFRVKHNEETSPPGKKRVGRR